MQLRPRWTWREVPKSWKLERALKRCIQHWVGPYNTVILSKLCLKGPRYCDCNILKILDLYIYMYLFLSQRTLLMSEQFSLKISELRMLINIALYYTWSLVSHVMFIFKVKIYELKLMKCFWHRMLQPQY